MRVITAVFAFIAVSLGSNGHAGAPDYGPDLERFTYPHPVSEFEFTSQREPVSMAFMDVQPEQEPAATVVLLHGKNFCGAYWHQTIDHLAARGYRVVVPDQIGFCKSSKPEAYQYTFAQLADNTRKLLDALDVEQVKLLGHSMGGMLATRFALQYPDRVEHLAMLNPIGLEDWRAMGVPYRSVDQIFESEMEKDYESIREYQKTYYYDGNWNSNYDRWARMLAATYESDERDRVAWAQARTADMVMTQPVLYQFDQLEMPVTLLIGDRDRTAIGRPLVDDELGERMGDYTTLGDRALERLQDGELILFEGIGHMPHIEAPEQYLEALDGLFQADLEE
ncbi:alpha/beta hydrolase [Methylonatrum kenyense]|uniref:alpha/beta fold hydrolase n=1 Tax=Methylonatrum kenyense TaxID=455253 RepID=UPI0020BFE463|nr:alpha/beta hydrolase [Methylonatrum kenyense]MCK8517081.1 alpha/beta hydrolase [Methylonatrum kenyense]